MKSSISKNRHHDSLNFVKLSAAQNGIAELLFRNDRYHGCDVGVSVYISSYIGIEKQGQQIENV